MFDDALTTTIARARRHALGDLLRRSAARVPGRTALRFRDRSHTYAELAGSVRPPHEPSPSTCPGPSWICSPLMRPSPGAIRPPWPR